MSNVEHLPTPKSRAQRRAEASAKARGEIVPVVLRRRQVVAFGYIGSEAALDRARKDPDFPKAIRIGPNSIGFRKADLDAWLATRETVS
jgi:predicted DNA-binding transcriptional regulator AlpA